jgi:O-antigen/teichoic acid export membrane protein
VEEKAVRGVPWNFLAFAGSKTIAVLTIFVLARLLSPADFGVMALALVAMNFLLWLGNLSFANALVVRQDLDRRAQGTLFSLTAISSVLAAAIAIAVSPLAASIFHEPKLTGVLSAMGAVILIAGVSGFYDALLQRELEFRRRFAGYTAQAACQAVVSIALAAGGAGVWSLVGGQLAGWTGLAVVLFALAPYRPGPRWDRGAARSIFASGRGFFAQGILWFIRLNVDNVVVGRVLGTKALGYYTMAYRLCDLSYWAIAEPVARTTFPAFARSRHRGEDIRPTFLSVLRLVGLVGCPFGILLAAGAEPIVRALFGDKWLPMIGPLAILGLWAAVRPIESTLGWLLNSIGHADAVAWISAGILVPLIPGFIIAINVGTLTAVAIVVLGDALISLLLLGIFTVKYLELSAAKLWGAVRPIVLAAPVMWLVTWSVGRAAGPDHAIIGLVLATLAGLGAYAMVITMFDAALLRRAVSQVLRTVGRAPEPTAQ